MALGIKCGRVARHERWVHQQEEQEEETGFGLITVQLGHCGGAYCTLHTLKANLSK